MFFKRLKENVRTSMFYLACVFMITLLMGGCASSDYKKQTSSNANETSQVSLKGESEEGYSLTINREWVRSAPKYSLIKFSAFSMSNFLHEKIFR